MKPSSEDLPADVAILSAAEKIPRAIFDLVLLIKRARLNNPSATPIPYLPKLVDQLNSIYYRRFLS